MPQKKANGVQPAAPPPQQRANQPIDVSDPMLQGTYVSQDDIGTCQEDLDHFEARLQHGVTSGPSQRSTGASIPRPKVSSGVPASTSAKPKAAAPPPTTVAQGGNKALQQPPRMSEEEEERLQDIEDVRALQQKRDHEDTSSDDDM
mmetsp:Transcript_52730/g.60598  ORF Transcript_52730/g.60598 Transcript_52730/m.60598 type:complete len:146 (+) Transcript_52730:47-484(+)